MTAPQVSIITPTRGRPQFLRRIARCVFSQTVPWEWLVLDDSEEPNAYMQGLANRDPRVHYLHNAKVTSIGEKRNAMIASARAPYVAHFDDDDIYGPAYLERMLGIMRHGQADLLKLSGFYLYSPACDFLGYVDLNARTGWRFELTAETFTLVEFRDEKAVDQDFILFYGFSFVYRRDLAVAQPFENINLFDDARFAIDWANRGCKLGTTSLPARDCLRWVHPGATSRTYSQYRIPTFLMPELFPFLAQLNAAGDLTADSAPPS